MFKNVASQKVTVFAFDYSTGAPKTGDAANLTAYVSKDDGTVTVLGDTSATEKDATNAKGSYDFDLTQSETNADKLVFTGKSSTSNVVIVPQTIYTLPASFTAFVTPTGAAVNTTQFGGTSVTGRDIGASVLLSSGTGTGQVSLSSGAVLLQATQTGVTIPTVTTLTNAPSDSSGTTTLLSRLSATRAGYLDNLSAGAVALASTFSGITSLAQWLGLLAGKQTGNSTARTEVRATGAGSGTFDETTDSQEALRDNTGTAGAGLSNIGTIATVTNLTNAPTSGDFTSTMKTSIGTAVAASAVASVTGNVGGNVTGSVGSVTGAVGSVTGNVGGNVTGSVGSVTGAVGSVTGNVGGNVTGSIGSLGATAKSDVNAEVLDVLTTDTFAELTGVPAATSSLKDKINWLFILCRNKITQTSTTQTVKADDGSTTVATSTVSDDGTTYTRGEFS